MANHNKRKQHNEPLRELEANTRINRRKARENACDQVEICFGFASDWLRRWRDFLKPIEERSKTKPKQFNDYFRRSIENRSNECVLLYFREVRQAVKETIRQF